MDLAADAEALRALGRRLADLTADAEAAELAEPLARLLAAVERAGRAWSGSPIGYHSRVYYRDFAPPPAGARFSREWGFMDMMSNSTRGEWVEMEFTDAVVAIHMLAGNPDLRQAVALDKRARSTWDECREEALSILAAVETSASDDFVALHKARLLELNPITEFQAKEAQMPTGNIMSRDSQAMGEGLHLAPHQAVFAQVVGLEGSIETCTDASKILSRLAQHIARFETGKGSYVDPGTRVFIGHGRSPLWRELKDFISERLKLPWDEFNRVPVAGVTTVDRLTAMLDNAAIAFLVLTGEDEHADAALHPRLNVVHEAGLFQGRLGFSRAIVLVEENCAIFSNIDGLTQIRFPVGNIEAVFERVRGVLEREGLIS